MIQMSSIFPSSASQPQPFSDANCIQPTSSQRQLFQKQQSLTSHLSSLPCLRSQPHYQQLQLNQSGPVCATLSANQSQAAVPKQLQFMRQNLLPTVSPNDNTSHSFARNPFHKATQDKQSSLKIDRNKLANCKISMQKPVDGRQLPSLNIKSAQNRSPHIHYNPLPKSPQNLDNHNTKKKKGPQHEDVGAINSLVEGPYNQALTNGGYCKLQTDQKQMVKDRQPRKSIEQVQDLEIKRSSKFKTTEATELSSSEQQYDSDATPGPGYYDVRLPGKQEIRSKKRSIQQIFYCKSKRFRPYQQDQCQPKLLTDQSNSILDSGRKKGFFLSRLPKFEGSVRQNTPPPGHYNTRQSLEYDLVRNILKSSNSSYFGNSCQRSLKLQRNDYPGPGSYSPPREQLDVQQNQYMFKSNIPKHQSSNSKPSFLISQQSSISLTGDREASLIHVKTDYVLQDYQTSQSPPFLSSSERFPFPPPTQEKHFHQIIRKSPKKQCPSFAPFNSTSKRQLQLPTSSGVGVGLYTSFLGEKSKGNSFNTSFR